MLKDDSIMPWGKHQGKKMANVPSSYLLWLYEEGKLKDKEVKAYVEDNLVVIRQQVKSEQLKNNRS